MKFTITIFILVLTTLSTATKHEDPNSKDTTSVEDPNQTPSPDNIPNNQRFGDRQWRYKRGKIFNNKGDQYRIKVVKKPGKNGKINTIHLYPMKKDNKKNMVEEKVEQNIPSHQIQLESDASTRVEKMMEVPKYEDDVVGEESHDSHHYEEEHKEKIKIKHHHHHHHHNHVKTVVKKEPYPVEKIVHVPKPYSVEKIVEKVVHVPYEKIVKVPVEKVIHIAKPYPVEKIVEKIVHVPKPYPVKEYVEKKVPYPVEKIVERVVEKTKYIHIPKPYPVVKHVHVPVEVKVPVPVEKKVYVAHPVEVEKKVPYPVKVYVPQPYPVEKKIPVPVQVKDNHHHHHPEHHHYSSMDDHHGYLKSKFHEQTAASNDKHILTSIQRHSITDLHQEQMKQFQQEQHQLDQKFKESQQQQEKLNQKFKSYKKSQQAARYKLRDQQHHQMQQQLHQQHQIQQQQLEQHHQVQQQQLQSQIENQSQPLQPIHGLFGQKMYKNYAKPYYPSEHQHQSILTLQTRITDEHLKSNKNVVPDFQPIANVRAIPIESQPLQQIHHLYPTTIDQQEFGASSNIESMAVAPPNQPDKNVSEFQINVTDSEHLPQPEALTMDAPYQFQPQPEYSNMFQVFQFQPVSTFQSETQSHPIAAS